MTEQPIDPGQVPVPQDLPIVEAFDLGAWLAGAKPPTAHVRVIGAGHLLAEYEELDAQLTDLRAVGSTRPRPGMFVSHTGPQEPRIVARMDAIRAEIAASTIDLRFRALPFETQTDLDDSCRGKDGKLDPIERQIRWIAAGCESHPMTVEQARQMRLAIGDAQYDQCFAALWRISQQPITVPFSLAHSVTPAG